MKVTKPFTLFCIFILLTPAFHGCGVKGPSDPENIVDVGIYTGSGAWDVSVTALRNAITAAEFEVETFDDIFLFNENLHRYRIIVLPGGDPREYSSNLGPIGRSKLKSYVEFGGSFFGVGGGASVADSDSGQWTGIGLFYGDAVWPVNSIASYPNTVLTDIELTGWDHEIGIGGRQRYTTLYRWGPDFQSYGSFTPGVIYSYGATGTAAIVAFTYGAGKVVLSGCQLEIEENHDRDGVDYASDLNDPDSEWDLIERILLYCYSEI